jgi:predicted nucleotidyltransferase
MNHGLTDETLAEIHRVLALQPAVEKAVLYGSRAKGTHRPGSDIDLALVGSRLDNRIVGQIADDFEEGPLPYRVDLSILKEIRHIPLKDHIRRVGVVLYEKEPADVTHQGS